MVDTNDALDTLGSLISALKAYSAKLPTVVHLKAVPGGIKPTPEAVTAYEQAVYRFRELSAGTTFRRLIEHFIESLEAFENGILLGSIQPLLSVLDHIERMQRDKEIVVLPKDEARLKDYRLALNKILPGSTPELKGAGRGL